MKVSIIMVCLNSELTIKDSLESFKSQLYKNKELIIIDGASTDKTLSIIEKYNEIINVLKSEPDNGIYDALNKGISYCTGDVIGLLHADDVFGNNRTLDAIANKIKDLAVDSVYGDLKYLNKNTNRVFRTWISGEFKPSKFKYGWMPPHPTFFVKKSVFIELGNYRVDLDFAADYELMLRFLFKNKISVAYVPEFISVMRTGGKSNASLKNRVVANKEDKLAWKLNGLKPPVGLKVLKPLRKIGQFFKT